MQESENGYEEKAYDCPKCKDTGFIVEGWTAHECSCMAQRKLNARIKNAMIPDEFRDAEFENYKPINHTQNSMLKAILDYLEKFDKIRSQERNSFGFIAVFGEQRLKEVRDPAKRGALQRQHNNFGLGKTHLQVAAVKQLIKRGYTALIVSDVTFMEDLSNARTFDDEGEVFNRLIWAATTCDVLVWDDIGKSKKSESKEKYYYRIINERYRARKPIIFSSNEDKETLAEKIGGASASRLFGMSLDFLFEVEGQDYRLTEGERRV